MLDLLQQYALDHGLVAEPGFAAKEIRWALVFSDDGRFLEAVELGEVGAKKNPGRRFPKCPEFSFSDMKSGGVIKSHFLWEAVEVVALHGPKAEEIKTQAKHRYFIDLLKEAAPSLPALGLLAGELEKPETLAAIQERLSASKARPADKVTFRIDDFFTVESDAWHDWWRALRQGIGTAKPQSKKQAAAKDRPERLMRCFITGEAIEPTRTTPKIAGLADVGGMSAGDSWTSFKQESFQSFGLAQSLNASVSEEAAYMIRDALNRLIKDTGQRLAGAKVVHWFKKSVPREDDPLYFLEAGEVEAELDAQRKARDLLQAIRTGQRPDLADNHYYALTLSGAAGRVMIRDWMVGPFQDLVQKVEAWFDDLTIVRRDGGGLAPGPKFLAVLGATVRDLGDLPPPFVVKMWRVAVRGEPIPRSALAQALFRSRVDVLNDNVANHARMGLMKAYHVRNHRFQGGDPMAEALKTVLNPEHPHPAYHAGRLMAVMAALQRRALGDVGAGVVQRYYAAASATPALVLGRLARTSQFHLNKLDTGLAHWYENRLAAIWGRIHDGLPKTLTLEEQSLFALGYYQEIADLRGGKADRAEKENASEEENKEEKS